MNQDPLIGRTLANFKVERAIGRGGMAQIYYGQDIKLKRPVALKVIDARHRGKPAYAKRFVREAQTIAKWRHEHIIQIYYADDKDGLYYFVMEHIDGQDLSQMMAKYKGRGRLIPQAEVLRIGRAVASALDYAHKQGVIHRDVKPSNILVAKNGRIVLTDFGLALNVEQGSLGEVFGSANYIAPEQARNSAEAVPQSDLYALGVILYELLTGRVPFQDPSSTAVTVQHLTVPPPPPRQVNPSLNKATETVLLKALHKAPDKRYQTGAALIEALEKALQLSTAPATTATPTSGRRWPIYAAIGAVLLIAALVAATFWLPGFELPFVGAVAPATIAEATPTLSPAASLTSESAAFVAPSATPTPEPISPPTAAPAPPPATPVPEPAPLADTQRDFSEIQGAGNWEYQFSLGRDSFDWQKMDQFSEGCWRWAGEPSARICPDSAHPGLTGDIAWRWQSSVSGPIHVSVSAKKIDTSGGDGVIVLVYHNTTEIKRWQLGASDGQGFVEEFILEMAEGDYVFFVLKAGADPANDETAFQAQLFQR
ncbi:MAG: hypothetical protein Fur0044_03840 [Anaerolineae bacterium]